MSTLYFGRVEGAAFEKMTYGARRRAEARSWFDGMLNVGGVPCFWGVFWR